MTLVTSHLLSSFFQVTHAFSLMLVCDYVGCWCCDQKLVILPSCSVFVFDVCLSRFTSLTLFNARFGRECGAMIRTFASYVGSNSTYVVRRKSRVIAAPLLVGQRSKEFFQGKRVKDNIFADTFYTLHSTVQLVKNQILGMLPRTHTHRPKMRMNQNYDVQFGVFLYLLFCILSQIRPKLKTRTRHHCHNIILLVSSSAISRFC